MSSTSVPAALKQLILALGADEAAERAQLEAVSSKALAEHQVESKDHTADAQSRQVPLPSVASLDTDASSFAKFVAAEEAAERDRAASTRALHSAADA